jgi:hypothetical protein
MRERIALNVLVQFYLEPLGDVAMANDDSLYARPPDGARGLKSCPKRFMLSASWSISLSSFRTLFRMRIDAISTCTRTSGRIYG